MFSNMYKGLRTVPAVLKEKLHGRKALHIHEYNPQAGRHRRISEIPHHSTRCSSRTPPAARRCRRPADDVRIEGMNAEKRRILDQLYEIGERPSLFSSTSGNSAIS